MAKYFIEQIEILDIWSYKGWAILSHYKQKIDSVKSLLEDSNIKFTEKYGSIMLLWDGLVILGRNYEDLCREWFLPKLIGAHCSYPDPPEIIKVNK